MKVCELDKGIKEIIDSHHVYGAECIINALVYACKDHDYLNEDDLVVMVKNAFNRRNEE